MGPYNAQLETERRWSFLADYTSMPHPQITNSMLNDHAIYQRINSAYVYLVHTTQTAGVIMTFSVQTMCCTTYKIYHGYLG